MKFLTYKSKVFGHSTLKSGRHFVCMSCYNREKDTLTPCVEYKDGDHEPDGDSLCKECSGKETTLRRPGLEAWIALSQQEVNEVWERTKENEKGI